MDTLLNVLDSAYFLMPTWKWLSLILAFFIFPILRRSLDIALQSLKRWPIDKNPWIKNIVLQKLETPVSWIISLTIFIIFLDIMDLPTRITKYGTLIAQILIGIRCVQLLYKLIDAGSVHLSSHLDANDSAQQIIPFAIKIIKTVLIILGVLIVLQNLGINVASLLAGLGIGGIAIALAGQESVANLFGSITILLDKPFRLGDHIKVMDVEGNIIEIGFRSTKIRTLTNSVVTIPNSTIAKEKVENLSFREKRRFRHTINLAYETPIEKIKSFVEEIRYSLKSNPKVDQDGYTVHVILLGSYSIDIQVTYFIKSSDAAIENDIQQDFLLQTLEISSKLNIEIAYPTQKILKSL